MTVDDWMAQLTAVIARQQRDLEQSRAQAAADAVVNLAKGVLVERLRCSPGEAATQLAQLAQAAGLPLVELAADIINQSSRIISTDKVEKIALPHQVRLAEAAAAASDDGTQLAAAIFEETLVPAGAAAVAMWMIEPDGALQLAGEVGLGALEASRWRRIPPQMDCLAQRVAHEGIPSWSAATPRTPTPTPTPQLGAWHGARAALPLKDAGRLVGVMEICWPAPLAGFSPTRQGELLAIADICARVLRHQETGASHTRAAWLPALLDGLAESVLLAHAVRDEQGRVVDFHIDHVNDGFVDPAGPGRRRLRGRRLLHAYPLAGAPGGLFDHAVEVLHTGQPYHAHDLVARSIAGDTAPAARMEIHVARLFDGIAITWRMADETDQLATLLEHAQWLGRLGGWHEDILSGDVGWTDHTFALFQRPPTQAPVTLAHIDKYVHAEDREYISHFRHTLLKLQRPAAVAFRLIRADGAVRHVRAFAAPVFDRAGMLVAVRGAYQDLSHQYHTELALAATQDQLADSEQQAEDQRRLALQLQQAIVPSMENVTDAAGLDVAVRYRPAQHLVGGDWYEAVVLPSKEVLLAVGDIAGHGIDAVTGMVTLRNGLRGFAMIGAGPDQLLTWLNGVAYHLTDNVTATVVCGLYSPDTRTLRWAHAGHLPPVLVRDGGARILPPPSGLLLGVDADTAYEEATTPLAPGDVLLLFTDGLIERRGASVGDALNALLDLADGPVTDVHQYAERILGQSRSDTDDDTCLIVVRIR